MREDGTPLKTQDASQDVTQDASKGVNYYSK
jgi:hypothetical protein